MDRKHIKRRNPEDLPLTGHGLKTFRHQHNLRQVDLARILRLTQGRISILESTNSHVSRRVVDNLRRWLVSKQPPNGSSKRASDLGPTTGKELRQLLSKLLLKGIRREDVADKCYIKTATLTVYEYSQTVPVKFRRNLNEFLDSISFNQRRKRR